jgi:hypothetical protein
MDLRYEQRLETEIDRELKRLPDLSAPPTLGPRVLAAIAQRLSLPWYRQSWQRWPVPFRIAFLFGSLALVAALGFALWKVPQTAPVTGAWHQFAGWFSWAASGLNVISTVLGAVGLAAKQLGVAFFAGCLLLIALLWAVCVGLGTVYVRLALARR